MLSLFKTNATPALVVYLPPMTYVSGSTVDGEVEVDFRKLQEDNIEEIHVRLRGTARTYVVRGHALQGHALSLPQNDPPQQGRAWRRSARRRRRHLPVDPRHRIPHARLGRPAPPVQLHAA